MSRPTFPFIVGCGRSGTTLLRAMFDAHPQMAVPEESHFVARMGHQRGRYEREDGFDHGRFVRDLFETKRWAGWVRRWELTADEVVVMLRGNRVESYADAVRVVFAAFAARQGKSRYGDKTPGYVSHIPLLAELFPEARFVHVIRDGRDVALSFIDARFGPVSVAEAAIHWRTKVQDGRRAGKVVGGDRYRELRYEHLVDAPETVLVDLCRFTGLDFDERMLRHWERGEHLVAAGLDEADHRHLLRPPTPGLRDWRTEMSHRDAVTFDLLAGDTLAEVGYERARPRSTADTAAAVAGAVRAWTGWQARRVRSRF